MAGGFLACPVAAQVVRAVVPKAAEPGVSVLAVRAPTLPGDGDRPFAPTQRRASGTW